MKRLISIIIASVLLMVLLPSQVIAEEKGSLSYERAVALMNLKNGTIKRLQRAENKALKEYMSNAEEAKRIDTQGFTINFGGEDYFISYDPETKVFMTKMKELFPEQMKFSWEATRDNRIVTTNTFKTTLRGIFFVVYNSQADLQLKQKQFELAKEVNRQDQIRLKNGMITVIDMQESEFELLQAQKGLDAAQRNFENAIREFNQFTGLKAELQYTEIKFEEKLAHPKWQPVDYYIEQALSNRFDMVSIRKQISLKEQERKIIEASYVYKISTTAQDEHERLLNDLEQLNLDLESARLTIMDEINGAYIDVIKAGKSVDNMNNTLKLQRSSFAKMQSRYKAGVISKNILAQAEIGLMQVENGYKATLYDYNSRILRFNNATGIGPGY